MDERSLTVNDPLPYEPEPGSEPAEEPEPVISQSASAAAPDESTSVALEPLPVAVKSSPRYRSDARWWALAATSALLLVLLTIGGVWLITKKPSTVDQLVILTAPSGAEVKLNSVNYGYTPVKLEQVPIGTYTLTITKDGYETIVEQVTISDSTPIEYRLKLLPPTGSEELSAEERIERYKQYAEDAFARGDYAIPFEDSALYYTMGILEIDGSNAFALDMKERLRKRLLQISQAETSRGDFGRAQEIMSTLLQYYPENEEVHAAASRLEKQLLSRRGELQNLVRKAEEALRAGDLITPYRTSAYYYAKQVRALDRTNAQAIAVLNAVKERLLAESEDTYARGEADSAIKLYNELAELYPEDGQIRSRLREITAQRNAEIARANDPWVRRIEGLKKYGDAKYSEAVPDLQFAAFNGQGTLDVVFALARSYMKLGEYDKAIYYFNKISPSDTDAYRSSVAALGEIAYQRGDRVTALEQFKKARRLGGSTIYLISMLDDKIEEIEQGFREKAAEPTPVSIEVKHPHGGLFKGSCSGTLSVGPTGVSYDGEHAFSANLMGVGVKITKDEMKLTFRKEDHKFKAQRADAERFSEALTKYQNRYAPRTGN